MTPVAASGTITATTAVASSGTTTAVTAGGTTAAATATDRKQFDGPLLPTGVGNSGPSS
jgi:hypothetical protein